MEEEFQQAVAGLTSAILRAVEKAVPVFKKTPYTKCWWNDDIREKRKEMRRAWRKAVRLGMTGIISAMSSTEMQEMHMQKPLRMPRRHIGSIGWKTLTASMCGWPITWSPQHMEMGERPDCHH
jgi:hypothetical protein